MIIVGEKLNSSIPKTLEAINKGDTNYLIDLIVSQQQHGAHYLDINTSICGDKELSKLLWLIDLVLENSKCGIMIDSPNPLVVKQAIGKVHDRPVIVNSVTLSDRIDELLPVIKEIGAGVVCLPIGGKTMPKTVEERVENSRLLIEKITGFGVGIENIYIDVLVEALSVGNNNALLAIETIREIKKSYPLVKTLCGVSNISFGLPKRVNINCAFLSAAVAAGLNCAIMDITSPAMKACLKASLAVAGRDDYCLDYIGFIREMQK